MTGGDIPPHRVLFHAYTYQYHQMEFSIILITVLENVINLEKERLKTRFWFPSVSFHDFFHWSIWDHNVDLEREDDENPNIIRGKERHDVDLGVALDPDALPPRNSSGAVMNTLHHAFRGISVGNQLFAIKSWHTYDTTQYSVILMKVTGAGYDVEGVKSDDNLEPLRAVAKSKLYSTFIL